MWKRSHGGTIKAPPDERGGNRYVLPKATAPHLDSTLRCVRCAAKLVGYWTNNGQRSGLELNWSAANDPKRTFHFYRIDVCFGSLIGISLTCAYRTE
jgi:hypothetical protein